MEGGTTTMGSRQTDSEQDKPTDLSMKTQSEKQLHQRKVKYIPPPLDLNAHTLEPDHVTGSGPSDVRVPKSPNELPRECLPLRKRHLVESKNSAFHCKSPKSAGPVEHLRLSATPVDLSSLSTNGSGVVGRHTAPSSPLVINSSSTLTPTSATSNNHFTHFPVPPPLIPVPPGSGNAVAAVALAAMTNAYNKANLAKSTAAASGFPTPPTDVTSPYAWTHSPFGVASAGSPFSPLPLSPFPVMLSPTASHPSSLSSSREDIQSTMEREIMKRRLLPPTSTFDASPAASPLWSFGTGATLPTPVWQCFQMGVRIKFLIPNADAPWQKAEELAWKDQVAMKIDARNTYQYAPHGLVLVQSEENEDHSVGDTILRFTPAQLSGAPDILVEVPLSHPFLVKDKGWCSLSPLRTTSHYGIRCHELTTGDTCLPPNHPEAIRTPDLCDRFKRFEFSTVTDDLTSPRAIHQAGSAFIFGHHAPVPTSTGPVLKGSPPPPSPAKIKKEKDCDKPKRPMNGFMLFAKKYRLELIQQHPGKDNRAISVLLGEAWKSLPIEEREAYSNKAKVLADEQKKIHPDCWKRKKTVANSSTSGSGSGSNANSNTGENKIHTKIAPPTNVTLPLPISLPPPIPIMSEIAQRDSSIQ